MDASRDRQALYKLQTTDLDRVEVAGVRWAIREF